MRPRYRRKRIKSNRRSLRASNLGPFLALIGTILGILAFIGLILYVVLPFVLPLWNIDYRPPFSPTPTPAPTAAPTPTPRPIAFADLGEIQQEVLFTGSDKYTWFGDPYAHDGKLLFSAGQLVNMDAVMNTLFLFDTETQQAQKVDAPLANQHFMFPAFNDNWIVYFDAKMDGGGRIIAIPRKEDGSLGTAFVVKQVYTGQPKIELFGDYLAWIERTGSRTDKLFIADLTTAETATLQIFTDSPYGQSAASFINGYLIWADAGNTTNTSDIYTMSTGTSLITKYSPNTYVHDPKGNGRVTAWLNSNHAPGATLYACIANGKPVEVATDVVDFGISKDFIAYSKGERIYVYFYASKQTYPVTPERELAQFLSTSDGYVMWMDVTTRERDVLKYAYIE